MKEKKEKNRNLAFFHKPEKKENIFKGETQTQVCIQKDFLQFPECQRVLRDSSFLCFVFSLFPWDLLAVYRRTSIDSFNIQGI